MSNISVKSRATSNPNILCPGSPALVPQTDVRQLSGLRRLARSGFLPGGRQCFLLILENWASDHFPRRAKYTAMLALSSLECRKLNAPFLPLHYCFTGLSKPKLKMVSAVFQPPADPYLASLRDYLSTC